MRACILPAPLRYLVIPMLLGFYDLHTIKSVWWLLTISIRLSLKIQTSCCWNPHSHKSSHSSRNSHILLFISHIYSSDTVDQVIRAKTLSYLLINKPYDLPENDAPFARLLASCLIFFFFFYIFSSSPPSSFLLFCWFLIHSYPVLSQVTQGEPREPGIQATRLTESPMVCRSRENNRIPSDDRQACMHIQKRIQFWTAT